MLVLTRKVQQGIKLGPNIEVRILDVRGGKVRLGISAPDEVIVLRSELEDRNESTQALDKAK